MNKQVKLLQVEAAITALQSFIYPDIYTLKYGNLMESRVSLLGETQSIIDALDALTEIRERLRRN